MSMMLCNKCDRAVDTDDDPDSLYVIEDKCVCKSCRWRLNLPSEFEGGTLRRTSGEFSPEQRAIIEKAETEAREDEQW